MSRAGIGNEFLKTPRRVFNKRSFLKMFAVTSKQNVKLNKFENL